MINLPAKKHIATLSQIIVLILLAATFFRMRVTDSVRHREDFETINALGTLAELPVHNILVQSVDDGFRQRFNLSIQDKFIVWLNSEHKQLDDSRREVRQSIAEWLEKYGLSASDLGQLSGKGGNNKYTFLFFSSSLPILASPLKNEANVKLDPPIALLLEETRHISSSTRFSIVTSLQASPLPSLDFQVSQNRFGQGYRLESLVLFDNRKLVVKFVKNTSPMDPTQKNPKSYELEIPVITQTIEVENLLPIIVEPAYEKRLQNIHADKKEFKRLLQTYGILRLKQGKELTAQFMLESYQDVEMLGFRFSPQYFWVFVFIFQFVCLMATAMHIRAYRSEDNKEQEPTTFGIDFLLDNRFTRITLWCLMPSASMILSYPLQSWMFGILVMYWGAIVILILTGAYLYRISVITQTPS